MWRLREYIFPLNQVGAGLIPPLKLFFQSCSRKPELRMGLYDTTIGAHNEVLDLWNEFHWRDRIIGALLLGIFCECLRFLSCRIGSDWLSRTKSIHSCMALSRTSSRRTTGRVSRLNKDGSTLTLIPFQNSTMGQWQSRSVTDPHWYSFDEWC